MLKYMIFLPAFLLGQIEKQVRDENPGLFINQRLYHNPPRPLFKGRAYSLDFITNVPDDSVLSATLFFKTNFMGFYQEFLLEGSKGLYKFQYKPDKYPGTHIQYYFVLTTENEIHGTPIDDEGQLTPVNKLLIDPSEYFKQQARLNR